MDVSQGSSATPLRCGGIVNDDFVAYLLVNLSVKKCENRSTFGEVMDNIVVPYFLTHSVDYWLTRNCESKLCHRVLAPLISPMLRYFQRSFNARLSINDL